MIGGNESSSDPYAADINERQINSVDFLCKKIANQW
jgi:hypothetical protein